MRESEGYLHYIWSNKLVKTSVFKSTTKQLIEILSWGDYNTIENGPDFKFGSIRFNNITWYGHIEIHQKSSDWFKHSHHLDVHYKNVILHVVREHDIQDDVFSFPTIILSDDIVLFNNYHSKYRKVKSVILCGNQINESLFTYQFSYENLVIERMIRKSKKLLSFDLKRESIAGFGKNTNEPLFRFIADNWTYSEVSIWEFMQKNQLGLLNLAVTKSSFLNARIQKVYEALHFFVNQFPTSFFLISPLRTVGQLLNNFIHSTWYEKYKSIGYFLLINIWLPFFWRSKLMANEQIIALLKSFPKEKNEILTKWIELGIQINNALESQAILEIYSQLCIRKKCLTCPFGK
ncbi:MAG: DUF2851 family protein, partial [Bacteroidota bacterium]